MRKLHLNFTNKYFHEEDVIMYGLKKIKNDGKNEFKDFVWPIKIGENTNVEVPSFYCLPEARGNWSVLVGDRWAVVEFDENDMVLFKDKRGEIEKCGIKKCKLIWFSKSHGNLLDYFDYKNFDSKTAYQWAVNIGDQYVMIDRITESEWAYKWAIYFGDDDIMIDRITDSEWAFKWARDIGNKDIMIDRITEPEWSSHWIAIIGDMEKMIEKFPGNHIRANKIPTKTEMGSIIYDEITNN